MNFLSLLLMFCLTSSYLFSQDSILLKPKTYGQAIISAEDTIYLDFLEEVELIFYRPKNREEAKRYYTLRKKVLKVYPYAYEASKIFVEINTKFENIDRKRQEKRYAKRQAKWIKETFGDELKKLRRSEGKILIKLLHRNLQISAYELIKTYRNGLSALAWQTLAAVYDADLKTEYRPNSNDEDRLIEIIIQQAVQDQMIEESKLSPYQVIELTKALEH